MKEKLFQKKYLRLKSFCKGQGQLIIRDKYGYVFPVSPVLRELIKRYDALVKDKE